MVLLLSPRLRVHRWPLLHVWLTGPGRHLMVHHGCRRRSFRRRRSRRTRSAVCGRGRGSEGEGGCAGVCPHWRDVLALSECRRDAVVEALGAHMARRRGGFDELRSTSRGSLRLLSRVALVRVVSIDGARAVGGGGCGQSVRWQRSEDDRVGGAGGCGEVACVVNERRFKKSGRPAFSP